MPKPGLGLEKSAGAAGWVLSTSAKAGYRVCLGSGKISRRFPRQTAKSGYV
jgi:hypothetical protein